MTHQRDDCFLKHIDFRTFLPQQITVMKWCETSQKAQQKPLQKQGSEGEFQAMLQTVLSLQRNKVKKYLVFLGQNPVPFANRSHLPAVELILQMLKLYVGEKGGQAALKDNLLDQLFSS